MQPGTVHDLPGVYRVCLLTGAAGEDASARHDDPDLLGHLWAGSYLAFPDAVTRVLHDDHGVAGYCLGVPDTVTFESWVDEVWLPPLRERHPLGSGSTPADAAVVERLHHPTPADAGLLAAHPAHLHVDLLPRLQGQGWGRRVVESVLAGLRTAGATACTWAWTRPTPGHSGSTRGSASPSSTDHRGPATTGWRSRRRCTDCRSATASRSR